MGPGMNARLTDIRPVQRVVRPALPKPFRLALPTEHRAVMPHEVDLVFCRFVLLEDKDTEGQLMFAGRATIQCVFAAAEVSTVREIHAVFDTVTVLADCANFAVRPKGKSDAQG